jgi:hypothetical protein
MVFPYQASAVQGGVRERPPIRNTSAYPVWSPENTPKVIIPQGKPEGNSFSPWNVSGLLTGEMKK